MPKLFSTRTLSAFHFCDYLGISSWMCDAECRPISESGTEDIFEATLMVFRGLQRTWPTAVQLKILNFFVTQSSWWMPKTSTFIFEFNFSNRYVPLNNLNRSFMAVFSLLGQHCPLFVVLLLYIAHRICFFISTFFCRRYLASRKKFYAERLLPH